MEQSKRSVSTDKRVLVCEGIGNRSHSTVGIGAFLILQERNALSCDGSHILLGLLGGGGKCNRSRKGVVNGFE